MKKLIDECEFKIQFSKKKLIIFSFGTEMTKCNYYVMYYVNNNAGQL